MRLIALFAIFTLVSLAIETTAARVVPIHAIVPNLIVILAVDLGLRHHGATAAVMAFAMGYAADAVSGANLGMNAFLITAIFLASYEISVRLIAINAFIGALIVLFAAPIAALGSVAIAAGPGALSQTGPMVPELVLNAMISAIAAPPVFAILAYYKRIIGLRERAARK